jgi:hypothetical protein
MYIHASGKADSLRNKLVKSQNSQAVTTEDVWSSIICMAASARASNGDDDWGGLDVAAAAAVVAFSAPIGVNVGDVAASVFTTPSLLLLG